MEDAISFLATRSIFSKQQMTHVRGTFFSGHSPPPPRFEDALFQGRTGSENWPWLSKQTRQQWRN